MFWSNSKFKIHIFLHYSELWRLITSSFKGCFQYFLLEKLCILVYFFSVKISYQSKKLWVDEKHFSRQRFSHRCDFLEIFSLIFDILKQFCWHNESIEWYFFLSMCLYVGFESLGSLHFFIWAILEIEFHLQICF